MRKLIVILFVVLLIAYVGGAICGLLKLFGWNTYLVATSIVGGLASVLSLGVALLSNSKDLIRDNNSAAIQRLADAAKEIEDKEHQIKDASDKIASLQIKKDELEILVKKASLSLYYKDELDRLYQKLLDLIHKNEELNNVIMEIPQTEDKLVKLNGEIEKNSEIQDILATIQKARNNDHNKPVVLLKSIFGTVTFEL